jgi:Rrf2 family protein
VAAALGAPANYLSKILRRLAQKGLLRSVRGPHGGFELLVAPESLTTSELVEAVDEVVVHAHCLLGDRLCDPDDPCDAHVRWTTLMERVRRPLEDTSMADLLGDGYMVTPDIDSKAHLPSNA